MTNLWGKSEMERSADRQQMIFEREEIARRDEELRLRRAPLLQSVRRDYYFGTDIPIPSDAEVQMAMNIPRDKWPVIIAAAIGAWLLFAIALLAIIIVAAAIGVII